jgi:hypothetical protein
VQKSSLQNRKSAATDVFLVAPTSAPTMFKHHGLMQKRTAMAAMRLLTVIILSIIFKKIESGNRRAAIWRIILQPAIALVEKST